METILVPSHSVQQISVMEDLGEKQQADSSGRTPMKRASRWAQVIT